ncbi:MAG: hypothetical protein JWR84_1015 [Caulobacter sp.]|nr:hypothetical protein [Caulobacter sp.]
MKKLLISAITLSLLAGAATTASAAGPRDHRQDPRASHQAQQQDNRYERRAAKRFHAGRYQPPRGYQARRFHRGQQLPAAYRNRAYAVNYRTYGLQAPPRGYEYRRVGNDVVLTALASGIITAVVLDLFN